MERRAGRSRLLAKLACMSSHSLGCSVFPLLLPIIPITQILGTYPEARISIRSMANLDAQYLGTLDP